MSRTTDLTDAARAGCRQGILPTKSNSDVKARVNDLLSKENISKADREKLKQASKSLLASLKELLKPMRNWTKTMQTQAEVRVFILDNLWQSLPRPPFSEQDTEALADRVYDYVWQRSTTGQPLEAPTAA